MARGTTLLRLLDLYRAECRISLNPAHNAQVRDVQVNHIQRVQEWLWGDFDWPLLRVERFVNVQNGQRYYAPPEGLDVDRIQSVEIWYNQGYCKLGAGIDAAHFTAYDSELDQRQWPPQRWRLAENEQIELWPIPDTDADAATREGQLRIIGIRKLRPLVDDADRAEIDDRTIVLYCAAEYLASTGAKDAGLKLDQARAHYAKTRGHQSPRRVFDMFDVRNRDQARPRVPIAVYNKPSS